MAQITNQLLFIFFAAVSVFILYLLAPMLTPFLLGTLLAYLSNPLVKLLERWHLSHLISVTVVFIVVFCAFGLLVLMLIPIVESQVVAFIAVLPKIIDWVNTSLIPWVTEYVNMDTVKATITANAPKSTWVFTTVLKSGYTIIDWIVNIVLTPVVTFYLLRDWDHLTKLLRDSLPKSMRPTLIKFSEECDEVLSAFFRGQLLVMLSLCLIYGIGLTLVGLQVGLMIGIIGGLLSIVPYLGSIFVVIVASIAAVVQFGTWEPVIWVLVVYLIGQAIEGYVLTPYFVGNRIGLHPVAVIFAIMAGGTLFGFFGVLVALPVAAVIMVMLRFAKHRYHLNESHA